MYKEKQINLHNMESVHTRILTLTEIKRLVQAGSIIDLGEQDSMSEELSFASPMFLIPKVGLKLWQLVIDIRTLNSGLFPLKIKMERLKKMV